MQNQMMPKINLLKMPDPAARTQKYVNMMNATKQQEAAEQTLKLQQERAAREEALQEPALATAKSEADIKKLDFMMQFYKATANDIANSSTPDEVVARAERLKQQFPVPELQARIDETVAGLVSDPSRFEENRKRILIRTLDAKDQFAVNHSDIFDMDGNLYTKRTSPIGAFETEITPGLETDPSVTSAPRAETPRTPVVSPPAAAPRTPTAPTAAPAGPVPVGKYGEARVIPDNARPLTPDQQDHIRRLQDELGMTNTPASFTRGGMATPTAGQMSPDMVPAILDSAINTGVMAQIDLDQMLAMSPPQARQGIMDVIRSSNISLQADAPSLAASAMPQQQPMAPNPVQRPQSQFADMRGPAPQASFADLGGQPQMQNMMAQYQVGKQIRGRNPSMSPLPGSSQVPLPRLGAEKRVEAQAAKDVELAMAPQIATATKSAERAIELKSTAKKAKFDTEAVIDEVADRINTIDQLLRNPNRFSIIGPIEGNLPRLLQTGARADAQAAFDKIKNTATLTSLIDMRRSTETGASPVGANPTDRDAKIVEQAASKLIQTGETAAFDAELMDMRRKLYRTYVNAQREYDGVYGDVLKENPNLRLAVPKVSDRYLSTKDLPKQKTPVKTPTSTLSPQTRKKYGL
jgi:hypothetical protein